MPLPVGSCSCRNIRPGARGHSDVQKKQCRRERKMKFEDYEWVRHSWGESMAKCRTDGWDKGLAQRTEGRFLEHPA